MNQQDPLAQLRDIHLPGMPVWWPPAPGWWLLAVLLLAAIAVGLWLWRRHWQQQAYRRQAVSELERAWAIFIADANANRYAQSLSQILRRTALAAYPRHNIASLTGSHWLQFLDASSPQALKGEFSGERGHLLASLTYRPVDAQQDLASLHALAMTWVRDHSRKVASDDGEGESRVAV